MNSDNLYSVVFDEHNQAVVFTGNMRPKCREELMDVTRTMFDAVEHVSGILYIDLKRLRTFNNTAFKELV